MSCRRLFYGFETVHRSANGAFLRGLSCHGIAADLADKHRLVLYGLSGFDSLEHGLKKAVMYLLDVIGERKRPDGAVSFCSPRLQR